MNRTITKSANAYAVSIFICGNIEEAKRICIDYCTSVGLCVTVTPTTYCYRGGMQEGMIIGLINYARFPSEKESIWNKACDIAWHLKDVLNQGSFTVQDDNPTLFISNRDEDQ